jgi:hypothetical protein
MNIPNLRDLHAKCRRRFWNRIKNSNDPAIQQRWSDAKRLSIAVWNPFLCAEKKNMEDEKEVGKVDNKQNKEKNDEKKVAIQRRVEEVKELVMQGSIMRQQHIGKKDDTWVKTALGLSSSLLKFGMNAITQTLPSLNNLKRWGLSSVEQCRLCDQKETIMHVESFCPVALNSGRYTWRHNKVLSCVVNMLKSWLPFGSELLADLPDTPFNYVILPADISKLALRPDICIIHRPSKRVVFLELSVPDDSNMDKRHNSKVVKYSPLCKDASSNGWNSWSIAFEVSWRGLHNGSLSTLLRELATLWFGAKSKLWEAKSKEWKKDSHMLLHNCSMAALNASYVIWRMRTCNIFDPTMFDRD